ncbi:MAG TPA: hypothetical protein PKA82_03185 [Pyrinomonadaceae bacterium]|nr:hypothetical protein [Pyrinomonadaceae bacterium]
MKKIILSAIIASTSLIIPAAAEAKTSSSNSVDPQIRVRVGQPGRRVGQRRARVVTQTRIVTIGRFRYREVVRVTYHPNGRVTRYVVSRQRIGRSYGYIR